MTIDEEFSEITDESSTNSIKQYDSLSNQRSNVLVINKGKVKDSLNFKREIDSYFTSRDSKFNKSKLLNVKKESFGLKTIRGVKSKNEAICFNPFGMNSGLNIFKVENNNTFLPESNNKARSKLLTEQKRNYFKTSRSVSRKISSRKILHLIMRN